MNTKDLRKLLSAKLETTSIEHLSVADLAGVLLLETLERRGPPPELAKAEGRCTVVAVDGRQPPPAGWSCRCFEQNKIQSHSFTGPTFGGQWAAGEEGAQVTTPPTFKVTNPQDGEVFFVQARCT